MWSKPLDSFPGIPVGHHPGAFGFKRKHEHHTGIDLYTLDKSIVYTMEDGEVVCIEKFTGLQDNSPWWRNTDCLLIKGESGVICYGEIFTDLSLNQQVKKGDPIARIEAVLHEGRERPDIPGHSRAMLHIELYPSSRKEPSTPWHLDQKQPDYLLDPTKFLLEISQPLPEWEET